MATPEQRFWRKVNKSAAADGCWLWTGWTMPVGYGQVRVKNVLHTTHRLALEMALGRPIGEHLWALHTCDNRACVRNEPLRLYEVNGIRRVCHGHLFEGTRRDNVDDALQKGRFANNGIGLVWASGESNPSARLTEADVLAIRLIAATGDTSQRNIARQYGVSEATISEIVNRKAWAHI